MSRGHVFYVEDEPALAKIVKESLESQDFEVSHVSNGSEALETFKSIDAHICLLDIMLPGMNGFDIARGIRSTDEYVPILFLTAKSQADDVVRGFESGANDYLKKPFSMKELIVRIDNLLKLGKSFRSPQPKEIFIGHESKYFPHNQILIVANKKFNLSFKETLILSHLMADGNDRPTARKKLLLEVWGDDSYFNSRNLDVYIRKLRKYLEGDSTIKILTLKGVGYRMVKGSQ